MKKDVTEALKTNSKLISKILGSVDNKFADTLDKSVVNKSDFVSCDVPILNAALSADLDGGLSSGLLMIAGQSKHFKSGFTLYMISQYLQKKKDSICVFFDSEFGSPMSYFKANGIDAERVVHLPITNIEELKTQFMNVLENVSKTDNVIFAIDSIGNLASKKEVDDALDGKSVADMTRAKQLKSFFRMVTPNLKLKNIPLIVINHTYKEMSLFPKDVVGGGTGSYYSSNDIWIIGRQQDKDNKDKTLDGYNFVINIEKSRYVVEKSKFVVNVNFEKGIDKYSGLFDIAYEDEKFIASPEKGYFQLVDQKTGELKGEKVKKNNINSLLKILATDKDFKKYVIDTYKIAETSLTQFNEESTDAE